MVMLRKKRVVGAAIELTTGTKVAIGTFVDADSAENIFNSEIQPGIDFIPRPGQGSFSQLPGVTGLEKGTVTFSTEVYGANTALPFWAQVLLPACGYVSAQAVTPWTFKPSSSGPVDGADYSEVRTITLVVYEDGDYKMLHGCMGTWKLRLTSGRVAMIEWTFSGTWNTPGTATIPTPNYPIFIPAKFMATSFLIGGSAPVSCIEAIEIDAGNSVTVRTCADQAGGVEGAVVVDRKVMITMNPESVPQATEAWYADWLAGTEVTGLSVPLTDTNNTITFTAGRIQRTNVQEGDREGIQIDNITWQANKVDQDGAGDDELQIVFAVTP